MNREKCGELCFRATDERNSAPESVFGVANTASGEIIQGEQTTAKETCQKQVKRRSKVSS